MPKNRFILYWVHVIIVKNRFKIL